MNENGSGKLKFGNFRVDPRKKVVWSGERTLDLPPKAAALLCLLAERRGDLVTKDEIWNRVWDDAFVEETNLTHNIYLLRKTFRELGAGDIIKTVPRRGYRLAVDVEDDNGGRLIYERATVTDTYIEEVTDDAQVRAARPASRFAAAAVSVLLVAGAAVAVWMARQQPAAAADKIKSLAVIPFASLNGGAGDQTAGIGIADLLITRLSCIDGLVVRPTGSVVGLDRTDPVTAGRKLGVDAILEGTINRGGGQTRITARLVKVSDAAVVWSGEFQKPDTNTLAVENELALHIVDVLAANTGRAERDALLKRYTGSSDAHRMYELGRIEWNKRSTPGMIEAQRHFRNAIATDPEFALAYAGLAEVLATGSEWSDANGAVSRALELDPMLAEAHATDGFLKMFHHWDWDAAERSFRRSIELNPGYAPAHHWYATLLAIRGRLDEAKREMKTAIDINPASYNYTADMGQLYYFSGEHEIARRYCRLALEMNPDFSFAHLYLYFIALKTGDQETAVEALIRADGINDSPINYQGRQARIDSRSESMRRALREGGLRGFLDVKYDSRSTDPDLFWFLGLKHALLGENEAALKHLERAAAERTFLTAFIKAEPILENLRGERRFQAILEKMGLADRPSASPKDPSV